MENKQYKVIKTLCSEGKVFKKGCVYQAEYTGDGYFKLHAENGYLLFAMHLLDRVMDFWKNHLVEVTGVS